MGIVHLTTYVFVILYCAFYQDCWD